MAAPDEVEYLTVAEIARNLRVTKMTVHRMINRGDLPAYRFGSIFRVTVEDFEAYVASSRVGGE